MNFIEEYNIPKNICDEFIKYHQENKEYKCKGPFPSLEKKSTDVYFYNNSNTPFIQKFFKHLSESVQHYCDKYNIRFQIRTFLSNHIQYYKPGEGVSNLHYEKNNGSSIRRELVYMLYCNSLKKGGTYFPNQNKTLKARTGKMYIWPAFFTHPHQGVISKTEEKYIVTGWFEVVEKQ